MTSTSFQHAGAQCLFIWAETGGAVEAKPRLLPGGGRGRDAPARSLRWCAARMRCPAQGRAGSARAPRPDVMTHSAQ